MYGIQETSDLFVFIARLGNAIDEALKDGKINIFDIDEIFAPAAAAKPAFEGSKDIPKELGDLDSEESFELVEVFAEELSLRNELAKELSVEGLALATALVAYVNKLRALKART